MDEKERAKLKKAVMFMTDKDKGAQDLVRSAFRKVFKEGRLAQKMHEEWWIVFSALNLLICAVFK